MGKEVIEKLILVLEKSLIFSQKILYEPLDVITLGTCFSMFVYIHARFSCVLIGRNLTAQSTGSQRGIGGGIQISEKRHSCKLSFLFPSLFFFFDHWSNYLSQSNQCFQATEFVDRPILEKLDMGFLFYGHEVLQVECMIVKYKATRINTSVTHT